MRTRIPFMMSTRWRVFPFLLLVPTLTAGAAQPPQCQPKHGIHQHQPQFHIIAPLEPGKDGTAWPMGLNDANAVFQRNGVWHMMHQCDGATIRGPCGGGTAAALPRVTA
jgi:hypothetical protein